MWLNAHSGIMNIALSPCYAKLFKTCICHQYLRPEDHSRTHILLFCWICMLFHPILTMLFINIRTASLNRHIAILPFFSSRFNYITWHLKMILWVSFHGTRSLWYGKSRNSRHRAWGPITIAIASITWIHHPSINLSRELIMML